MSRRDEIMDIAKVQMARQGYSGTSMRDIAEASGLLAGSLYSHFRSKMELVGDIVIRFYAELIPRQMATVEAGGTGAEQFARMVREVFAVCATHPDELTILHYDWHILSSLDELADVQAASIETLDLWRGVIESGRADGSIDPDIDTDALVRVATSSIHALIDTVRYTDRPMQVERDDGLAEMLVRVLTRGVAIGATHNADSIANTSIATASASAAAGADSAAASTT